MSRGRLPCAICGADKVPGRGMRLCAACQAMPENLRQRTHANRGQSIRSGHLRYVLDQLPTDVCVIWPGYKFPPYGYGSFRGTNAHRAVYLELVGPVPDDMQLDHLCRVPSCVNPAHMEIVTLAENTRRTARAQKTHCVHGHEFTPENTYIGIAAPVAIIAAMYTADALGNLATGTPDTSGRQGGSHPTWTREGSLPAGGPTSAPAVAPTVRPVQTRAARSRPTSPGHDRATSHRMSVTAYCWTGSRTASGAWPQIGMAAGNTWAFGTRLRVEGLGIVTIADRYGHGTQLDIYMGREGCEQRARTFGRRWLRVEVVQ